MSSYTEQEKRLIFMNPQMKERIDEGKAVRKEIDFRRRTEIDFVERKVEKLVEAIKDDDYNQIAHSMARIAESLQYYIQFRKAAFRNAPPEDNSFTEIQTVFGGCYTINPDYIVYLEPPHEGDSRGSFIALHNNKDHPVKDRCEVFATFTPYDEMCEQLRLCQGAIRKSWGRAKQELDEIKKESRRNDKA